MAVFDGVTFSGHLLVSPVLCDGISSQRIGGGRMSGTDATISGPGLPFQLIEGLVLPQYVIKIGIFMILYMLSDFT